jgi:formate-dependent nitrite reductase cytochrome c552 subunit
MGTTKIHEPEKLWSVETGKTDASGAPLRAACVTCHTLRTPNALPDKPEDLKEFHQGMLFDHGNNRCASGHVVGAQDVLRLADGRTVPMRDAIVLCGQCHGSQLRDYKAGAHGGMNGYWDLASGDRLRNHCVDCHDPHVPRFAPSNPVLPPRDRLLGPPIPHEGGPAIPRLSPAPSGSGGHP